MPPKLWRMGCAFKIKGYDHVKVALKDPASFETVLKNFGFLQIKESPKALQSPTSIWGSGDAVFCLYESGHPEAKAHYELHGDTVFDLAFVVESREKHPMRFEGVGKMKHTLTPERSFAAVPAARGILRFDHNTLNVDRGELDPTVNRYLSDFGFERGQYFDIRGSQTGLHSWVTRAPNKSVQIPFNEASDSKSQIQEYINIHRGPGVQHIAFLTTNIVSTMDAVMRDQTNRVRFLDIPDTYYEIIEQRMKIRENFLDLRRLRILADQDEKRGYLLQIFTQNIFGGFFIELIQREGNDGFGEGNFKALFESMELDQKRRGVL
jgi:4-hydroxyphenylpyruvate dioxygenase-like putative hemolysin